MTASWCWLSHNYLRRTSVCFFPITWSRTRSCRCSKAVAFLVKCVEKFVAEIEKIVITEISWNILWWKVSANLSSIARKFTWLCPVSQFLNAWWHANASWSTVFMPCNTNTVPSLVLWYAWSPPRWKQVENFKIFFTSTHERHSCTHWAKLILFFSHSRKSKFINKGSNQ